MNRCSRLAAGCAAMAVIGVFAPAAFAADETFNFVGTSSAGAYDALVTLDIVNGQAQSGQGTITGVGFSGDNVTLLTPLTAGAEQDAGGLFGYRFNDGTDLYNEDTSIPIDTNGILFSIGAPPAPGANAGFTVYSNGDGTYSSFFAGHVTPDQANLYGGGSTTVTDLGPASGAPEPASWALMLVGIGAVGLRLRLSKKTFGFANAFAA